jgi:hypothetical protein
MQAAAAMVAGPRLVVYRSMSEQQSTFAISGDGVSWQTVSSPCGLDRHEVVGSSPLGVLMDVCSEPVGGGWEPKAVWTSVDGAGHWTLRSRSPMYGSNLGAIGQVSDHGYPADLAMPTAQDAWMSMARDDLYETHDGGVSWTPSQIPGQFMGDAGGSAEAVFVDGQHGWAVGTGGMYRTVDGRHWIPSDVIGHVPG